DLPRFAGPSGAGALPARPFLYNWRPARRRVATRSSLGLSAVLMTAPAGLHAQAVELQLTPDRLTIEAGKRQAIYAAAYDRQGNLVTSAGISFSSSDTTVATVSRDGTVLGVAGGTADVVARADSLIARATVTVTGGTPRVPVASVRIEPRAVWLLPLEPARLGLTLSLADGSPAAGARVRWRTLDPKVATVDRDGLVVAAGPGQTLVEAGVPGGPADTVLVSVDTARFTVRERLSLAPGAVDTLVVTVPAQGGRRLAAGLVWESSDTAIVIPGAGGELRARAPGSTTVTVGGYGMSGRTQVFVHQPVHSLIISPRASGGPIRLAPGTSRRFDVRALGADSTPVADAAIGWTLSDSSIATYTRETGLLEARGPGTVSLTARLEGFEPATWNVEVVPATLRIDRARMGLVRGGRAVLRAELVDESGTPIPLEPALAWSSSAPSVTVDSNGSIEAREPGRATVAARTPDGGSIAAEVFVTGELLVSSSRGSATPRAIGVHQLMPGETELRPLLADSFASIEAVYAPDRSRIAFSSNRAGSFDLYLMDADGGNVTRLTSEPGAESAPAWAPDGSRIFFAADRAGGSQIASVAPDGSDLRVLTSAPGSQRNPSVSADGRSIAFASTRDGNLEIYRMDADGGNERRLTTGSARDQLPRWLPDGSLLYVSWERGARIMRLGPDGVVTVLESPDPIVALAASADGARIAYVAGRALDRSGSRVEYRLVVQSLVGGGPPVTLRFAPGEQVATPSF
ncbi:MAG: Ig-like domain-containing protein, partial [Gemmatimonadota bacterium]